MLLLALMLPGITSFLSASLFVALILARTEEQRAAVFWMLLCASFLLVASNALASYCSWILEPGVDNRFTPAMMWSDVNRPCALAVIFSLAGLGVNRLHKTRFAGS